MLCVYVTGLYKQNKIKYVCPCWRALPDMADKAANCKVMTAGERPSSRSQDPDVRPRGTDYCLGFEMDVSSVHAKSESPLVI